MHLLLYSFALFISHSRTIPVIIRNMTNFIKTFARFNFVFIVLETVYDFM